MTDELKFSTDKKADQKDDTNTFLMISYFNNLLNGFRYTYLLVYKLYQIYVTISLSLKGKEYPSKIRLCNN